MNLTLTPAAEKFIRRLLRFDGGPGSGLRLRSARAGALGWRRNSAWSRHLARASNCFRSMG